MNKVIGRGCDYLTFRDNGDVAEYCDEPMKGVFGPYAYCKKHKTWARLQYKRVLRLGALEERKNEK